MEVKYHGKPPYRAVAVHGGPGAIGSAEELALGLSDCCGVLEPYQTKYSISELIHELALQIEQNCGGPAVLIGHSWGAWLAALTAAAYPGLVKKLILIGSGPLEACYVPQIGQRRRKNLSVEQAAEWDRLVLLLESGKGGDKLLGRVGALAEKADQYQAAGRTVQPKLPPDAAMYEKIWPAAAKMRENGRLAAEFRKISCSMVIIHGNNDPHPPEGIMVPLEQMGMMHKAYILERCGHTPWEEQFACEKFFEILRREVCDSGRPVVFTRNRE